MSASKLRNLDIKILIFDLDGTLVDSKNDIANALNATLVSFGLEPASLDEVEKFVGIGVTSLISQRFASMDPGLKAQAIARYHDTYAGSLVNSTKLYPGVTEVLEHFRKKPKVVLTNKATRFVRPILDGLGITKYFSATYGSECLPFRKPDPRTIHYVCQQQGLAPEDAIIIGDTDIDIAAGKAAPCYTCAVSYGYGDVEKMRRLNPDFFVDDLRDIMSI
jgi:phosphoglycolate phosphatase